MSLASPVVEKLNLWKESNANGEVIDSPPQSLAIDASAIAAGVATRKVLQAAWQWWRKEDPPQNPAAPDVTWSDALIWAAAVGTAVGVSRVLSRRSASAAARKLSR